MVRILGVNLPDNKRVEISLRYIYGIGPYLAKRICSALNIGDSVRMKDLTEDDVLKIRDWIADNVMVEGELKTKILTNIRELINMGSYRGMRHRMGLPVKGQTTRSNARTSKKKVHLHTKN